MPDTKQAMRIMLCLCLAVGACRVDDRVFADEGRVCVENGADEGTLRIRVQMDECISACPEFAEASCDVRRVGDTLVVSSAGAWAPGDQVCIALCAVLEAECGVDGLEPGDYTLRHGEDVLELTVPLLDAEPACESLPSGG